MLPEIPPTPSDATPRPDDDTTAVRPRPHARIPLRSFEQYRVLLSPARFEIFEFMRTITPCSVAELAAALDRPADALYPHLRQLERIGVVEVVDRRPAGRTMTAVYDLTGDDADFDFAGRSKLGNRVMALATDLFLRLARRTLGAAVDAGELRYGGKPNLALRNDLAWLTPDDVADVRRHIDAIQQVLARGRRRRTGRLYMCMHLVIPIVRPKRK